MQSYFQQFAKQFSKNPVRAYLLLANVILTIFAIWFSNVGLLPFQNLGDFAFFAILALVFALYRPGWAFVLFIGAIALENINLAPTSIGLTIRPYQLFGALTLISVIVRQLLGRQIVTLPKFRWLDGLLILFAVGGFLSGLGAIDKGLSLKQAAVATSFVALYFLVRIYVQSLGDLKRIAPFFLSSGLVVTLYAIWQNARFALGETSFEVMAGRPNGSFTEPDWLGLYLTFLFTLLLVWLFYVSKNYKEKEIHLIFNKFFNVQIFKKLGIYIFLLIVAIALILTVSRSAWLGALVVSFVFLKLTLIYGSSFENNNKNSFWSNILLAIKKPWHWKKFFGGLASLALVFILSLGIVSIFKLTNFQLANRAQSTGGLQKITIACQGGLDVAVPEKISGVEELANYQCRHINLEEIEKEKKLGKLILEVYRPDPNVNIRAKIYATAFEQIKSHPIFGIGWSSIGEVLGTDERGTGLNASNILLEVWLGSGLLGFLAFVVLLGYLLGFSYFKLVKSASNEVASLFIFLGLLALIVPNLFNSGIFLGFVWVYLAVAVSLLAKKVK
jgi:hypothetical protein